MLYIFLAREVSLFWGFFSFVEQIQTLQAIVLLAGLVLLIIEIFAPGFGVAGGTGIALLILGIILTASTPSEALAMVLILVILIALVLTIIIRSAKQGKLSRTLILQSSSKRENGYSTSNDPTALIGKTGKATTHLRPAGSGIFEGVKLDIVTSGAFIEKGAPIRIVTAYGSRIVVEEIEQSESAPG